MKKFMQTSAVAKELAARKGDRDSMLMGLNKTAGSDDVDDDPADTLAYGHMRIRKDGTVMTDSEIRELRQRQGFCLTCPGEPIKLFAVKRSKMNPLYQKKEPIEVLNQSINGVCLICNSGNTSSALRSSFGKPNSGGSAVNADMLPGTLLSLRTDPHFKQMRKVSSFGANGIGEISGSILSPTEKIGGSMNGGFGTSITGPNLSPDLVIPLSSSQQNGAAKRRASSSKIIRSNSGDIENVARSLTPTRLHALRRSNSDDSIVSTGINGTLRVLPSSNFLLKRSKSNDFDSSLNFDFEILHGRSSGILSNQVTESDQQMDLESQQASHHDLSNAVNSKVPTWKEIADIAIRAKREKGGFDVSNTGTVQELRLNSVDSDGFFNGVDEMSSASESEFRNSFANLDSNDVAQENKRDLLTKQNSDFDANIEDAEMLRISSSEPTNTETKFGNNEAAIIRSDEGSSAQDQASPEKPLNQRRPMTAANEKSIDQPDLLHYTLLRFMKMSEERFDDLERQLATVLQQQTRILQQHGAILEILSDRSPVTPGGNTAVPNFRQGNGNENHPMLAKTVSPPLSDGVQEIEPSPGKNLKERSKSKSVSSPAQMNDASSPDTKLEKAIIPVVPDPDKFGLEHNRNAVALVAAAKGEDPTVGSYEDYEMQLGGGGGGGGGDSNAVVDHHAAVDDDTVIAANPPNLGASSPRRTSPTTTTTTTSTTSGRRGSDEFRRSSTSRKSIVDASSSALSSGGGGTRRDGSVPPSKVLRRKSSQKRLISAERSQGRILSISPGRRATRATRAYSADGDEMLMMMLAASTTTRGATTPKRENRADSGTTTATPPADSEQGSNGVEHKPRRGSSRRPRGDGDELSLSRNGGLDAKQDKKKEKRKLKKRSSTSKKADFATDEDDDNNS